MNENEVIERIKYLIKELNLRQLEFDKRIGVDASNLSKYLNNKLPISDAFLNRIVVNLGVSKKWLTEGSDLPFAKPVTPPITTVSPALVQNPGPAVPGTPVYDIDVTAGTMPRARLFADDLIVGNINLPDVISPNSRIVRVSGDSMSPVIRSGDYLAVRELSNTQQIFWGQIYVILLDDYRLVKYIRRHPDPNMVILRSENKAYDDMDVARADIRELMYVQNILHLDTRS